MHSANKYKIIGSNDRKRAEAAAAAKLKKKNGKEKKIIFVESMDVDWKRLNTVTWTYRTKYRNLSRTRSDFF